MNIFMITVASRSRLMKGRVDHMKKSLRERRRNEQRTKGSGIIP
jgi:hypothetical protein